MLDEHLRRRGIFDTRVLAVMEALPRERFVPPDLEAMAYADRALPIGHGQTISQPYIVALVAQSLERGPDDTVLEIGVGCGYMAAVLTRLAGPVVGVEIVVELAHQAAERLRELDLGPVEIHVGDGRRGWPSGAPYDAITVSAAAPAVPTALVEQLTDHGRLVMPLGHDYETQQLTMIRKRAGSIETRSLCPCKFVPLIGGDT
jgi:protein-L-isoaspartate(D-aspartate) O-methyltransferase